jgi:hypothetical protein
MPITDKYAAIVLQIQDNFALLSKWIEGLESLLDVDMLEVHLNTLKEVWLFIILLLGYAPQSCT